jgi:hypothetical protein
MVLAAVPDPRSAGSDGAAATAADGEAAHVHTPHLERGADHGAESLTVDCDGCLARGPACGDCVVTVLLGPPRTLQLDAEELSALDALAVAGLVPPLRLVHAVDATPDDPEAEA